MKDCRSGVGYDAVGGDDDVGAVQSSVNDNGNVDAAGDVAGGEDVVCFEWNNRTPGGERHVRNESLPSGKDQAVGVT